MIPFVALLLLGVSLRWSSLLAFFALTPDLDALFLVHRSFTHSLPVLLAAATPILIMIYRFKPKVVRYGFLGVLSVASHFALDLPAGYTPLLWPVYDYSMWVQVELAAHIGSAPTLALDLRILTEPIVFEAAGSLDAALFTGAGLIASLFILTPLFAKILNQRFRRVQS
jgi:membrane-bound metal-dependent hydrolase YbcI (DUF457 family)